MQPTTTTSKHRHLRRFARRAGAVLGSALITELRDALAAAGVRDRAPERRNTVDGAYASWCSSDKTLFAGLESRGHASDGRARVSLCVGAANRDAERRVDGIWRAAAQHLADRGFAVTP